jgi:RNA-directed DNA polymerase
MKVKASMPARQLNLVLPLAHEATETRIEETTGSAPARSCAAAPLIGADRLRPGDVNSKHPRSSRATTPTTRTSATATRTTTTSPGRTAARGLSADSHAAIAPPGDDAAPFPFDALLQAWKDCRANKRNTASAQAFEERVESNLWALYQRLCDRTYQPGRSICFIVTRPKPREVWAAEFTDRIVHHLVYNHIAPRFHASFVAGSSACIPGRGTLYAAERLEHGVRSITRNGSRRAFYLKCDLANFFVALDKQRLRELLARKVREPFWMWLVDVILFHDPRADVELRSSRHRLRLVPPHKSLFNAPADTGLPIGNLSSQFFANVFLDAVDQFVKHQLRIQHYVRYVDDFILLHESPQVLNAALARIREFLSARLNARLNESKTVMQPLDRGVDCVGHVITPWSRTLRRKTLRTALYRLEDMPAAEIYAAGNSLLGLARQCSHGRNDQARLCRALLKRGHVVDGNLTRIFRRRNET